MFLFLMAPAPSGDQGSGNPLMDMMPTFFMFGAVILIFYFMMIRPQQKRAKEHKSMLDAVKRGDKVVTSGGMHGIVSNVEDDGITITIAPNCNVKFDKGAIASVVQN
ncbi:MAG: preprotein translocase subunit YajC [bacterium]|nr:preprotein translocase subunit YajC [bacterium]